MAKLVFSTGHLPALPAFEKQFKAEVGSGGYSYAFEGDDAQLLEDYESNASGTVDAAELHKMLTALNEGFTDSDDEEAGALVEGILATLNIEWV